MREVKRTEELLAAGGLLDNLNETGSQLLDGGNVAGEDTHVTSLGGNVDLNTVGSASQSSSFACDGGIRENCGDSYTSCDL
jgi:hypothetical protein